MGAARTGRSLLFVGNLADVLLRCLDHPGAVGRALPPCDGPAPSTAELVRALAGALGRTALLPPVPPALLLALGAVAGRRGEVRRLLCSLEIDGDAAGAALEWTPPYTLEDGLRETAAWYRSATSSRRSP